MMKLNAESLLVMVADLYAANASQAIRIEELEAVVQQLNQALAAKRPPTPPAAN